MPAGTWTACGVSAMSSVAFSACGAVVPNWFHISSAVRR